MRMSKCSFRSLLTRFEGLEERQFEIFPKKKHWAFTKKNSSKTTKKHYFWQFFENFSLFFENFQKYFSFFWKIFEIFFIFFWKNFRNFFKLFFWKFFDIFPLEIFLNLHIYKSFQMSEFGKFFNSNISNSRFSN